MREALQEVFFFFGQSFGIFYIDDYSSKKTQALSVQFSRSVMSDSL